MTNKGILRIIDVNFNRCREGLRVIEDIYRFILEDNASRKKIRKIKHSLSDFTNEKVLKNAILSRDSKHDLGKKIDVLELKRKDTADILYINFQRVKESLRVLEEFFKIVSPRRVKELKKLRYQVYTAEIKALTLEKAFLKYD